MKKRVEMSIEPLTPEGVQLFTGKPESQLCMWKSPSPGENDAFEADLIASTSVTSKIRKAKFGILNNPSDRFCFDEDLELDLEIDDLPETNKHPAFEFLPAGPMVEDIFAGEEMQDCGNGFCRTKVEDKENDSTFISNLPDLDKFYDLGALNLSNDILMDSQA